MGRPNDEPLALSIAELTRDQAISVLCHHGNVAGRLVITDAALSSASLMVTAYRADTPEEGKRLYGTTALLGTPTSKRVIVLTDDEQTVLDSLPAHMRIPCECAPNPLPRTARTPKRTSEEK